MAASRIGTAADKILKQEKAQAEKEELEKVELGNEGLENELHLKYLGVLLSGDGDSPVPVNHGVEIVWSPYTNLKRILTSTRLPNSILICVRDVDDAIQIRILENYNSCAQEA